MRLQVNITFNIEGISAARRAVNDETLSIRFKPMYLKQIFKSLPWA